MTATDADLQELVSALQVQLREAMRERDAYRRWADKMPTYVERDVIPPVIDKWMQKCPQFSANAASEPVSD